MFQATKRYELTFDERPEYLYAFIKGNLSKSSTASDCWAEIIAYCRANGHLRLLAVFDGAGSETELEAFVASREIVDLGLNGLKIAYVDLDPANLKRNQFGELVANNRGAFAKVFTNESEAHEWLVRKEEK